MKLVFFTNAAAEVAPKVVVSKNGQVVLNGPLSKLLAVQDGQNANIAQDQESQNYYLCHWPNGNKQMPALSKKNTKSASWTFYSTYTGKGIWTKEAGEGLAVSISFEVERTPVAHESFQELGDATVYALKKTVLKEKDLGSENPANPKIESQKNSLDEGSPAAKEDVNAGVVTEAELQGVGSDEGLHLPTAGERTSDERPGEDSAEEFQQRMAQNPAVDKKDDEYQKWLAEEPDISDRKNLVEHANWVNREPKRKIIFDTIGDRTPGMSDEEAGWGPKGLENFYTEQKARPEKPTTKIGRPVGAKNKPKSDKRIAGQEQVVAVEPVRRKATPVTTKPTRTRKAKTNAA